ncbi:MAG: hypothetical protein Q8P02_01115, partial [Candidatus Micrarchaeota archaeon]|nr:hypothetical protein [Candidatus Micrarchaeota archaeon]
MELSCEALGGSGCAFVAEGESASNVKSVWLKHFKREHADELGGLTEAQERGLSERLDELL